MRIVSENSPQDLRKRAVEQQVALALRQLAANMLRIIRGAGKPYQLTSDLAACVTAMREYGDLVEHLPPSDFIARVLDAEKAWPGGEDEQDAYWAAWADDPDEVQKRLLEQRSSRRQMRLAALQITASMLAGQPLQRARGDDDLERAIARHERLTAEMNHQREKPRARKADVARQATLELARRMAGLEEPVPTAARARRMQAAAMAAPAPHRPEPSDRLQAPSYEGLRPVNLPDDISEEFGVASALDLVLWLNRLWRERGRPPLPQGQFPSNRETLKYVVKELRKERVR